MQQSNKLSNINFTIFFFLNDGYNFSFKLLFRRVKVLDANYKKLNLEIVYLTKILSLNLVE